MIASFAPLWVPHLAIQCLAAPLGGVSSTLITNPMDVIRARIQVSTGNLVDENTQCTGEVANYMYLLLAHLHVAQEKYVHEPGTV